MMEDSSYSKYGRKRQRLLDSEDDEGQLNEQGVLSLGRDMKGFDDWNKAKKDFNTLIQTIMGLNPIVMGVGAPFRHQSYIFGRPQENVIRSDAASKENTRQEMIPIRQPEETDNISYS